MELSFMAFMKEIPLLMEGDWSEEKSRSMESLILQVKETGFTGIDLTKATIDHMTPERSGKSW